MASYQRVVDGCFEVWRGYLEVDKLANTWFLENHLETEEHEDMLA